MGWFVILRISEALKFWIHERRIRNGVDTYDGFHELATDNLIVF